MSQGESPRSSEPLHFNPNAPGFDADPYPTYARLREEAPVYYWPAARAFLVSRFEDAASLMRDPRFSLDPKSVGYPRPEDALPAEFRMLQENGLFRLSQKDHARVRRAISPAFTPRAVERLRPDIQRIVDEALARSESKDEIDVAAFADLIPMRVIAAMLQIPAEHAETFRKFGQAFVASTDPRWTPEQLIELLAPIPPGVTLLRSIIQERRENLGEDLLSTLIRAEQAGDKLSEEEMLSLVAALITAGSETTVHFICYAVLNLLRHPEHLALVRREPGLLRGALEEVLRFDSFGKSGIPRFATEDAEIAGTKIPRGAMVMALIPAAARDPRVFQDADTFDPRRESTDNINFGIGAHYCLGASLARLEGEVAVSTLLRRFPHMRLAGEPVFGNHPFIREMKSLRVAVTPPTAG
jgi:cytochrome P450